MDKSSPAYRKALFLRTVLQNPWIMNGLKPWPDGRKGPSMKQAEFLALADVKEVMYGGGAGGGKSEGALMAALQFVDVPGYAALILRRTFTELSQADGLIDRAAQWLANTEAKWDGTNHKWRFPSGASLSFGHMDTEADREKYRGAAYQFICFDELTDFHEKEYRFLFRCLRGPPTGQLAEVPLRMRSTTTPGGRGHAWVKKRFEIATGGPPVGAPRRWIPAKLDDNPGLNKEEYRDSLKDMPETERRQHEKGDWSDFKGERFKPDTWPSFWDLHAQAWAVPIGDQRKVYRLEELVFIIAVDWATSDKKTTNCTSMGCGALTPDNTILLMDVVNEHIDLEHCVPRLARFCKKWKPHLVGCEAAAFQAALANECRRHREIPEVRRLMPGSARHAKLIRAQPAILMGQNRRIFLPDESADWIEPFETQLSAFTGVEKDEEDDMVDMLAYLCLMAQDLRPTRKEGEGEGPILLYEGRGQI
jgi:hypothetical protein